MNLKKKIMAGLLLFVMAAALVLPTAGLTTLNAQAAGFTQTYGSGFSDDNFEGRITCGLDGNYRCGSPMPITMEVTSLQSDFEGTFRVIVPSTDSYSADGGTAYEKSVTLAKGEENIITQTASNVSGVSTILVELEDTKGNIVLKKTIGVKSSTDSTALVGIISDDYTAFSYMSGVPVSIGNYSGNTSIIELTADLLPDQESGLDLLSYIVINSFDTTKFTTDQYSALKSWVQNGGVLIIGTGSDYKQTLAGFQDGFVNGTINGTVAGTLTAEENSGFNNMTDAEKASLNFTADQGLLSMSMTDGEALSNVVKESGLVWKMDCGSGRVVVTAFNLGMEPFVSFAGRQIVASNLFEQGAKGTPSERVYRVNYGDDYDYGSNYMESTLRYIMDKSLSGTKGLEILLYGFLVLACPVMYLILKKLDKREYLWGIIPAAAIITTVLVAVMTGSFRMNSPEESSVTSISYQEDEDGNIVGSESMVMAFTVPKAGTSSVSLMPETGNLQRYLTDSYYYYSEDQDVDKYTLAISESAEGYGLRFITDSTFSTQLLSADVSVQPEGTGMTTDLTRTMEGISGSITNVSGYDFDYICLVSGDAIVIGGKVGDGETYSFDQSDNIFVNTVDDISYSEYMSDNGIDDERRIGRAVRTINCFLGDHFNAYSGGDEEKVYICGYVDDFEADYVKDAGVQEHNVAQVTYEANVEYEGYEDSRSLNLYDYYSGNSRDWDTDGQMYAATAECEFDLSPAGVNEVYAMRASSYSDYGVLDETDIYAYNYQTAQYEQLFKQDKLETFESGCPYIDEKGIMKFRFTCQIPYDDYSPEITVIGGSRDAGN